MSKIFEYPNFGVALKYPTYRESPIVTISSWLEGKRKDDGAEGLWRIHETLYDLTNFVALHPGGEFWLKVTKGTDITEAFESNHLSSLPNHLLARYAVRPALNKRNYMFTMHENGFYKTLKSKVRSKLANLEVNKSFQSNLIHDGLLLTTISLSIASVATSNKFLFQILTALSLCWLSITSHNYFHRRDNWRMYTFNLTLMNFNSWRISHVLSHHVYPNTLFDLEMSMFEPFLCWIPHVKFASKVQRIITFILQPIIYALIYPIHFMTRLITSFLHKNIMYWHDIIGLIFPLLIYAFSEESFVLVLAHWMTIILLSSLIFGIIGLNAAHHHPEIYHDGDAIRADKDWGLFQIDTIIDRADVKGSKFLVLTHFGDHALHHLFPTLDHSLLPQLYPLLYETLKEFKLKLRYGNHLDHIIGQNKQLLRIHANAKKPGDVNYY